MMGKAAARTPSVNRTAPGEKRWLSATPPHL